jgi:hypothetical protein
VLILGSRDSAHKNVQFMKNYFIKSTPAEPFLQEDFRIFAALPAEVLTKAGCIFYE